MNTFVKLGAAFIVLGVLGLGLVGFARGGKGMNHPMGMGWEMRGGKGMMERPMMGGRGMMNQPMMGMGREGMMGRNVIGEYLRSAKYIGLSNEQVKKLKDRQDAFLKETIDLRAKLEIARIELRELLDQDKVDMAAVDKKVRGNQELAANLILAGIKVNQDAKNILTPNQRKKADALKQKIVQERMNARFPGPRMEGKAPQAPQAPKAPQAPIFRERRI